MPLLFVSPNDQRNFMIFQIPNSFKTPSAVVGIDKVTDIPLVSSTPSSAIESLT